MKKTEKIIIDNPEYTVTKYRRKKTGKRRISLIACHDTNGAYINTTSYTIKEGLLITVI